MMSIDEFARGLRARTLSAREVTDQCLRRIRDEDSRLNAFILVMADSARQQADQADREIAAGQDRGPLHGVPISIKDLFDIAGTATTAASRVREGHVATSDAPLITQLRQAGAVIVGKTNLHEFAFGTTNEDSAFGPARHPLDPTRSPGGSSGGSAVSLIAGMALAHRRDRYRRFDPDSRGHLRHRRPETDVGRAADRRRGPAVEDARSRRPADEQRHRRLAHAARVARAAEPAAARRGTAQRSAIRGPAPIFLRSPRR